MESTNPHAVPCHAPKPGPRALEDSFKKSACKGQAGPRLVAGGGLGSASSRLGWAGPTEMVGKRCRKEGESLQQGPQVPEKVQGLGTRAREGINLLLFIFVTEWKIL